MKKLSPSGKRRERALKKCATCRPSGCQARTSRPSRSKRTSRRTMRRSLGVDVIVDPCAMPCPPFDVTVIHGTLIYGTSRGVAKDSAERQMGEAVADKGSGWMTIENLSIRSGVTTRNIRAYQGRGLLPAPISRPGERSAFYTPEHLARLRLID